MFILPRSSWRVSAGMPSKPQLSFASVSFSTRCSLSPSALRRIMSVASSARSAWDVALVAGGWLTAAARDSSYSWCRQLLRAACVNRSTLRILSDARQRCLQQLARARDMAIRAWKVVLRDLQGFLVCGPMFCPVPPMWRSTVLAVSTTSRSADYELQDQRRRLLVDAMCLEMGLEPQEAGTMSASTSSL